MASIISAPEDRVLVESEPGTLAEIDRFLDFGRRHAAAADGRLRPMTSFFSCDMHTPASMRALAAAAKELGTGIHTHLAGPSSPHIFPILTGQSMRPSCAATARSTRTARRWVAPAVRPSPIPRPWATG